MAAMHYNAQYVNVCVEDAFIQPLLYFELLCSHVSRHFVRRVHMYIGDNYYGTKVYSGLLVALENHHNSCVWSANTEVLLSAQSSCLSESLRIYPLSLRSFQ